MSRVNQQEIEDGVFEEVESSCAALVPVAPTVYRATKFAITRPDASFVAHLIATAEKDILLITFAAHKVHRLAEVLASASRRGVRVRLNTRVWRSVSVSVIS